jgi:hypothetical protein
LKLLYHLESKKSITKEQRKTKSKKSKKSESLKNKLIDLSEVKSEDSPQRHLNDSTKSPQVSLQIPNSKHSIIRNKASDHTDAFNTVERVEQKEIDLQKTTIISKSSNKTENLDKAQLFNKEKSEDISSHLPSEHPSASPNLTSKARKSSIKLTPKSLILVNPPASTKPAVDSLTRQKFGGNQMAGEGNKKAENGKVEGECGEEIENVMIEKSETKRDDGDGSGKSQLS